MLKEFLFIQVVSETITEQELVSLSSVIKRKPVIWDNLHANDYDLQRVFLGPYSGRDPRGVIPNVRGVMTNPNCEYSLNVPAIHTLSAWAKFPMGDLERKWDPLAASRDAVGPFLEELRRHTSLSVHEQMEAEATGEREALTTEDVEMLFHFFWLPHSHGPRADTVLAEFEFLRDGAHLSLRVEQDVEDLEGESLMQ